MSAPANFDPVALARAAKRGNLNSRSYIPRFEAADTAPIEIVDQDTAQARGAQIVAIARKLLPSITRGHTDAEVLGFHRKLILGHI